MDEQEQQKKQDSFVKKQYNKGKDIVKDKVKKAIIKKIIAIIGAKVFIVIGIVLAASITTIILLAGFHMVVKGDGESNVNDAKGQAIVTSYSSGASITGTDENGNTVNKIAVTTNANNNGYEFLYNNDPEYLENVREKLEEGIVDSAVDFTDFELAVLGALMDNGADLDYYSEEELHCIPAFVKAEAATQNLDLRPNSEKQSGKRTGEYVDNFKPKTIQELAENEVPGTILVQRTNTNGTTKVTLEYKTKEEFYNLVGENNKEAINYFTIGDDGNIVIAKWDNVLVTILDGEYPENLDESEKVNPTKDTGEDIIITEPIPYTQYIAKYKMPFEILVQLLVITEEPEFCMELVDYVLNSKIVINIQEEETITVTDETRNYKIHNKDEKYVDYQVNVEDKQVFKKEDHFLKYAKDDETIDCTNYYMPPKEQSVVIRTVYTSHSYSFGISEADTWIARYKENPQNKQAVTNPTTTTPLAGNINK